MRVLKNEDVIRYSSHMEQFIGEFLQKDVLEIHTNNSILFYHLPNTLFDLFPAYLLINFYLILGST
jgi:hypothetical protein